MKKSMMFFTIIMVAVVMVLSTSGLSFAGDTVTVVVENRIESTSTRTYHTNLVVTEAITENFKGKSDIDCGTSKKTGDLVKKLFGIPGISGVFLARYEITITKGKAFSWEDMHPRIMQALMNHFRAKKLIEKEIPIN